MIGQDLEGLADIMIIIIITVIGLVLGLRTGHGPGRRRTADHHQNDHYHL